jgi:hypothetical protein
MQPPDPNMQQGQTGGQGGGRGGMSGSMQQGQMGGISASEKLSSWAVAS